MTRIYCDKCGRQACEDDGDTSAERYYRAIAFDPGNTDFVVGAIGTDEISMENWGKVLAVCGPCSVAVITELLEAQKKDAFSPEEAGGLES